MRTSPRGTRCHTQPRARHLLGPASSLGIGVQRGQRIRFIEGMGSGGSRHRHRVGWRLRWQGSPRPQAQWRRWSCRSGHSAGRGWRPPHCSPLRVGCRAQGVGGGGWPPPFPHPHRGFPVQPQLGSQPTHQQTCPAGYGPEWSWPSGGRSSGPCPWRSSPLWGSLHSRGSVPGWVGISKVG